MLFTPLVASLGRVFNINASVRAAAVSGLAAMAALAPAAHAAVVTSPINNVVIPVTAAGIYVNVVTGVFNANPALVPGWDIDFWGTTANRVAAPGDGAYGTTANSPFAALTVGSVVSAASSYGAVNSLAAATFGALAGQWALNSTNYFGFNFTGDDNQVHYAYGTMSVGATATARSLVNIFYDSTPNTAITVTAVPEPSTWAMMLGGLAVAGALARRRQPQA